MIPIIGFAPDADPTVPGVLTDCSQLIPFEGGFRGAPASVTVGASTLAAACRGASSNTKLDGSRRLFAGTATKLYELASDLTWTDATDVGGDYALGADDRWAFTQFGDYSIAATITEKLQATSSGDFAILTEAPAAKLVESAQGFVLAFNTTSVPDGWYCSAYLDHTDWTLDVATQCVSGRLVGGSGPITAARRFGDDVIAYKNRSMFVGRYVGAPAVWQWTQVSTDIGCIGQDAVVDTVIGHVFVGSDGNIYVFDGTTPRPLATGIARDWLAREAAGSYSYRTQLLWDRSRSLIWVFFVGAGLTGNPTRCLVYHIGTQKFGTADREIEAVLHYTTPSLTYDGGGAGVTTYDAGPAIPYDSPFWVSGASTPAVFTGSHVLSTLSGATSASSFTTGDVGDETAYSMCKNLRVRYTQAPTTSAAIGYVRDTPGGAFVAASSVSEADGKHPMRQRGRWHRWQVSQTGDFEVTAYMPEFAQGGRR